MKRLAVLVSVLALAGCAPVHPSPVRPATSQTVTEAPVTVPPSTEAPPTTVTAAPPDVLGALTIDDQPHTIAGYSRSDWMDTWLDPDHNGCDTREDALLAASTIPAIVGKGCEVTGGHWVSAYDGAEGDRPFLLDLDHVVPLAEAWRSGGWAWPPVERSAYAQDPADVWLVSRTSNRSKGDSPPNVWRPPNQAVWCTYAQRWIGIKVRWHLTATTPERDALGQMLDTCPKG